MCGLVGLLNGSHSDTLTLRGTVTAMSDVLIRRGPDAGGVWVDANGQVALGHRRLSIVDLSAEGSQPMKSPSGRFWIAFNGEIYNHKIIAEELLKLGCRFRGHSDTEVLVTAIEVWGVPETLRRLVGMFAFALWDAEARKLYLARDRLGEKPLYYGAVGGDLFFASELKVLRAHPRWRGGEINSDALALFLRYGYVPSPNSIYRGIYKLPPGTMLVLTDARDVTSSNFEPSPDGLAEIRPTYYWNISNRARELTNSNEVVGNNTVQALDSVLKNSIRDQMVADVPLGAFLSGGIDSSVVTAIMQSLSSQPISTFTIGFTELEFNEAEHAEAIAKHLGTRHTTLYVTSGMALDVVGKLADVYDEPFADSSQIPTTLLCGLARQHVTVCLSGDAGDELFGGYNRYIYAQEILNLLKTYPSFVRRALIHLLETIRPDVLHRGVKFASRYYPKLRSLNDVGVEERIRKLSRALQSSSMVDLYRGLVSYWPNPADVLMSTATDTFGYLNERNVLPHSDLLNQLMLWDLHTYLPDDNLVKVDRAAMFSSLETRLPLLDHRVVEFAIAIPGHQKIHQGVTKWPLRQVLYKYVPRELIDRPKMGFSVPIAKWLRAELREWAESLLSSDRLKTGGIFNSAKVAEVWQDHLSGRRDNSKRLWTLLMFEAWRDSQSI